MTLSPRSRRRGGPRASRAPRRSTTTFPPVALIVLAVASASLAACSSGRAGSPPAAPTLPDLSGVTLTAVAPSTTSTEIGAPDSPNVAALDASVRSNGRLFVFLPGTGGAPRCCELVLKVAATMGYAAIGLTYPNRPSVDARCGNDRTCYGTVRRNELDGADPGPASAVVPHDAIEFRLASMLSYLTRTQPEGPWPTFLRDGRVDWTRVVIAGHSQGGGEAAYIGKVRRAEGVVMLSSDVDSTNTDPPLPARYVTSGHLTPLDRYVGFAHTGDPLFAKITTVWAALGLGRFGPVTSVDGRATPYGRSRRLTTSVPVPRLIVLPEHDSTAVDVETPTCPDGTPRFSPVWRFMLEVAGGLPVTAAGNAC